MYHCLCGACDLIKWINKECFVIYSKLTMEKKKMMIVVMVSTTMTTWDHASVLVVIGWDKSERERCGVRSYIERADSMLRVGGLSHPAYSFSFFSLSFLVFITFPFLFVCAVYTSLIKLVTETIRSRFCI